MSEEQWRNDGPDIYARKAPDESLFDDDMALIGPVGVVSYLNRQEATIAQQQARIIELVESGRRFIENRRQVEQRLHDTEAELEKRQSTSLLAQLEDRLTAAQARIAALEEALERIAKHPGGTAKGVGLDWCRNEARAALASRALLSPAPADAAHEEGTP